MKSLQYLTGDEPTWFDRHGLITGLLRVALVVIGLAPLPAGAIWVMVTFERAFNNATLWNAPPYWLVIVWTIFSLVWSFIFINTAINLNP